MDLQLNFKPITKASMMEIMPYLEKEGSRTCDFSYGGILMWVDLFNYEYAIFDETLFIQGDSIFKSGNRAFSIPVGKLTLSESIVVLSNYTQKRAMPLELSTVPEDYLGYFQNIENCHIEEMSDWNDYLYEAAVLASLKGKKMSKKRNHVNQFISLYPNWTYKPLAKSMVADLRKELTQTIESEASQEDAARKERELTLKFMDEFEDGNPYMKGGVLYVDGKTIAFTIGDIKGDTLYIHVEKADRKIAGAFEMINKCFAEDMLNQHPDLKYINREDDAGDIGLRLAKQSYHPIKILKKYNIIIK